MARFLEKGYVMFYCSMMAVCVLSFGCHQETWEERSRLAEPYLKGKGLEIGALHNPLKLPPGVQVQYLDRMTLEQLRAEYPELRSEKLVTVDIVDDGEKLAKVQNATQDFVIANHFLEHCQNPILAIENMFRAIKAGGILFLAVPDKRYTFDVNRPLTPYSHLLRDYNEGPEWSRRMHFEEWVRFVEKNQDEEAINKRTGELMKTDYSIHYHVWTQTELIELFLNLKPRMGFDFELISKNGAEVVMVLRKARISRENRSAGHP